MEQQQNKHDDHIGEDELFDIVRYLHKHHKGCFVVGGYDDGLGGIIITNLTITQDMLPDGYEYLPKKTTIHCGKSDYNIPDHSHGGRILRPLEKRGALLICRVCYLNEIGLSRNATLRRY